MARLAATRLRAGVFEERHRAARLARGVFLRELDDGMAELTCVLPTVYAVAVHDRLTRGAKAVLTDHHRQTRENADTGRDPRSLDQVRADLLLDLLLTGQPHTGDAPEDAPHRAATGITAEVSIIIPALTLLGHSTEPAHLAGRGPIDLHTARTLAADTPTLVRVLTHPTSGIPVAVDTYRPSTELRRFLRLRDQHCRFPSCNRTAHHCDIDHTHDHHHGGPTTANNLACLCRRHHTLKHHSPWTVRHTSPGTLEWTSPHGRVTTDTPEPYPRFHPEPHDKPPPF